MSHLRLTHPTRSTLTFRQGQADTDTREAVANVAAELGVDRPPLVHTETRENTREITGLVTAPRRAANDATTADWRQALANYVDRLESHVDEFQGTGYTLEDDQLNLSKRAVYEGVEWSLTPGEPYAVEYTATMQVGRGTFEEQAIDRRNPTVDAGMNVYATVDGNDLPGMRDYRVRRSVGVDVNAVFDRDSAENNDVIINEGPQHRVVFEGTHTGTLAQRRSADATLDALVATKDPIDFVTKFPGYTLSGYVLNYESDLSVDAGGNSHGFRLEFLEGQRA